AVPLGAEEHDLPRPDPPGREVGGRADALVIMPPSSAAPEVRMIRLLFVSIGLAALVVGPALAEEKAPAEKAPAEKAPADKAAPKAAAQTPTTDIQRRHGR